MKLLFKLFVSLIAAPVLATAVIAWMFLRPARPRRNDLGGN